MPAYRPNAGNAVHVTVARNRAFSLVELLVVIAIIGILASILFPVFVAALEKARQATCASNLKQIGLATLQYVQDYDEVYPVCDNVPPQYLGTINTTWPMPSYYFASTVFDTIQPYLKSTAVLHCPSTPTLDIYHEVEQSGRPWDYGYNGNLFGMEAPNDGNPLYGSNGPIQVYITQVSQIHAPSTQIMYADFGYIHCSLDSTLVHNDEYGGYWPPIQTWYEQGAGYPASIPLLGFSSNCLGPLHNWPTYEDWNFNYIAPRHTGYSANCLYADGHLKLRPVLEVLAHFCGDPLCEFCN